MASTQFQDGEKDKFGENSSTCIIIISGNANSLGQIINCNREVISVLGYSKYEIIGGNVTRLMPKAYGEHHEEFMKNYLNTNRPKVIGIERKVMA